MSDWGGGESCCVGGGVVSFMGGGEPCKHSELLTRSDLMLHYLPLH